MAAGAGRAQCGRRTVSATHRLRSHGDLIHSVAGTDGHRRCPGRVTRARRAGGTVLNAGMPLAGRPSRAPLSRR